MPVVVAALSVVAVATTYSQTRKFAVQDLLSLEYLGSTTVAWMRMPVPAFSPDGRWLAFIVQRPRTTRERYGLAGLDGAARPDIWIGVPPGRQMGGISQYFQRRGILFIYVWNRENNTVRRISKRETDIGQTEITSPNGEVGPVVPTSLLSSNRT